MNELANTNLNNPILQFTDEELCALYTCGIMVMMICESSSDPNIHYQGVIGAAATGALRRVYGERLDVALKNKE